MAYTKQTWNDLPNTTTPVTATRLNHIENGIYDAHNLSKDAITLGLGSSNVTINVATSYTIYKVPLSTTKAQKNTNNVFSVESNGVKILKEGWYLITATAMINSSDNTQQVIASISRTRDSSNASISEGYMIIPSSGYVTMGLSPMLQYFNAGDIVFLGVSGVRTGNIIVGGSRFSQLTVIEL